MSSKPLIQTRRCLIRLAELTDLPMLMSYWTANGHRYRPPLPDNLLTTSYWTKRTLAAQQDFAADKAYKFYVFDLKESEVMGTIAFYDVRKSNSQDCTLGYTIGGKHEGKSLMFESVSAAIQWVFVNQKLHCIKASHAIDNPRSGRLLDRLGFETVYIDENACRRQVELCNEQMLDKTGAS